MKTIIFLSLLVVFTSPLYAQTLEGDNYILELTNENPSSPHNVLEKNVFPTLSNPQTISGEGFTALLSYNENAAIPTVITTSDVINFGEIKPGEAIVRTLSIKMVKGSANGYRLLSSEDQNLSFELHEIPGTSCDQGNCNQILSDQWNSPLSYGLGFKTTATPENQYKRLANEKLNEYATEILSSAVNNKTEIITFKLNIPGNQPQGQYQNIIKYIISPNI